MTRCQPSTSTNSSSLNGSDTTVGGIIIMPIAISVEATRKSITMKGMKTRKPIWKAVRSSLTMNAGMTTRSGRSLICEGETLIKGDAASASIAAASIVAKVSRDRLMRRLCDLHPAYGFSRHVGYGTPAHLAALAEHGPCAFHRLSFAPVRASAVGRI